MSARDFWPTLIIALWCCIGPATAGEVATAAPEPVPESAVSADEQVRAGLKLAHQGAWQAAIEAFNAALAIDPESGEALFFRGQAEAAKKDYPAALHSLAAALTHMPHEPAIYQTIGEVHAARGDADRAADALAIAADLYLRQDAGPEAQQTVARLREVKPDAPQLSALQERAARVAAQR
ncbi:MAG: tetratricopeptide repeat protein [Nitrospirota bacterium]|jgi:tetratricopeptide (TPR) repeat protein